MGDFLRVAVGPGLLGSFVAVDVDGDGFRGQKSEVGGQREAGEALALGAGEQRGGAAVFGEGVAAVAILSCGAWYSGPSVPSRNRLPQLSPAGRSPWLPAPVPYQMAFSIRQIPFSPFRAADSPRGTREGAGLGSAEESTGRAGALAPADIVQPKILILILQPRGRSIRLVRLPRTRFPRPYPSAARGGFSEGAKRFACKSRCTSTERNWREIGFQTLPSTKLATFGAKRRPPKVTLATKLPDSRITQYPSPSPEA